MSKLNKVEKLKTNEILLDEVKLDDIHILEETNIPAMGLICGYGCYGAACGFAC